MHDSKSGRNGAVQGGVTLGAGGAINGDSDTAMKFNGSSGEIQVSNGNAGVSGPMTIEGWVNPGSGGSATQQYFGWRNYTSADFYVAQLSNGMLEARFTNRSAQSYTISSVAKPASGSWHYVALTYDGSSTLTLYVDGGARASTAASGSMVNNGQQPNIIGGGSGGNYFAGSVDEVAVYSASLSASQISSHYQAGVSGGSSSPTPTRTSSPSPSPTATATASASPTATSTGIASPTVSPTSSATPPPSGSSYSSAVLGTSGLQDYYRLDETSGTAVRDSKGGRNGALQGGVTLDASGAISGDSDTAMKFDGTSGEIQIPSGDGAVSSAMSIEGWVNPPVNGASTQHYFGWRNYTSADFYIAQLTSGYLEARFTNSGGQSFTISSVSRPSAGSWHYFVLTYDGTTLTLYVDGASRASTAASGSIAGNGQQPNTIGGGNGGNYLTGEVDEVAVYNLALSPSQVAAHYQAGSGSGTFPTPGPSTTPSPTPTSTSGNPVLGSHWLGAMVDGYPGTSTQPLDDFINTTGLHPKVIESFQNWTDASGFYTSQMDTTRSYGALPLVTWGPNDTLANIINGSHDSYVHQFAQESKAWGHPFMLRFAHEMNGDWYQWGFAYGHNGNTPQQFIQAWQHVHDIFTQEGASNVIWVWCPNARWGPSDTFASFYPGDAYVDWIGFDNYNWGNASGTTWTSFSNVFKPSYDEITALTSKPLMIGEGASADGTNAPSPTAKGDWITQGFLSDIPNTMPRIQGFVWFNANKERDWRVNSSTSSLSAYRGAVGSSFWQH